MESKRVSGILLHPTSFPGRYGIGDLGAAAFKFIDFLVGAKQHLWQIMPLGPTGFGDSPYACFSAFAGNPLLVSPEALIQDELISPDELKKVPYFPEERVDYGEVIYYKFSLLKRSYEHFKQVIATSIKQEFELFCETNAQWLDDFALFMAVKEVHNGCMWAEWTPEIATRKPAALKTWKKRLADQIKAQKYYQFLFFRQWREVKKYANDNGIKIIGDIPIFVAYDSADVWSHPELFHLDKQGKPTAVAGVPPDYFSATGQLWGNPLYRWDRLKELNYQWWVERIQMTLTTVDIIRIDHFRGFEAYWEVRATETTAVNGRWVKGPASDLFNAIRHQFNGLPPIIAEDLGVITPEVEALRDEFGFPGMRVLQFAFGSDASNRDLPHNYPRNCVVYSGTHDNDTAIGWYRNSGRPVEHDYYRRYMGRDGHDVAWDLIRLALSSVADMAIIPLQDIMNLGSEARMNFPSKVGGNWTWRYTEAMLHDGLKNRLLELTALYGRENHKSLKPA